MQSPILSFIRMLAASDLHSVKVKGTHCGWQAGMIVGGCVPAALLHGNPEMIKPNKLRGAGHYDVQPAMERDWRTDPFELASIDGYFYARGASDNKVPNSIPFTAADGPLKSRLQRTIKNSVASTNTLQCP